jgi:protein-S-isoprenylcysteine O-methyltransferase Ste14
MAMLACAAAFHWLTPVLSPQVFSSVSAGVVLVILGFAIMMRAWWQFQQRQIAICPTAPTDALITDGIYRFTRNPMYLGMVLMLSGIALYLGSLPFYVVATVYFLVIDRAFCRYEEQKLLATFGSHYNRYQSDVRRWI